MHKSVTMYIEAGMPWEPGINNMPCCNVKELSGYNCDFLSRSRNYVIINGFVYFIET